MPQSLACVFVHLVFSTKDRAPVLDAEVRPRLHAFLAGVVRTAGCECHRVGGTEDHVHVAVRLARTISIAELVEDVKTSSSNWLKRQSADLARFAWQRGYGAFSFGQRDVEGVARYIDAQEEHHRARTFQDEYRQLLEHCGVEYDERYVWD